MSDKSPEDIVQEYESRLKVEAHYKRAKQLGQSDYSETEDRAKSILGDSLTKEIIQQFPDSHVILYHLGKWPRIALPLPKLWDTNPNECVNEIKKISTFLKPPIQISKAPPPAPRIKASGEALGDKFFNKNDGSPSHTKLATNNRPKSVEGKNPGKQAESALSEEPEKSIPFDSRSIDGIAGLFPFSGKRTGSDSDHEYNLNKWRELLKGSYRKPELKALVAESKPGRTGNLYDPLAVGIWAIDQALLKREFVCEQLRSIAKSDQHQAIDLLEIE